MMIIDRVQATIHKFEVVGGPRWLRAVPVVLALLGLMVLYDLSAYRNFSSPEAMDAAQVARNLATGRGYSTDLIRPFSLYLMRKHNQNLPAATTNRADLAQLNTPHPDLANAPVYPTVLAAMMKVWSPDWKAETHAPFWSEGGRFVRYAPEFFIAIFNQLLLLVVVILTFRVTLKLFDRPAAWLAAGLTLGSDLLWKFSISGLSTQLLLVIFLGLIWCLVEAEELVRTATPNLRKLFVLAILAGGLTGLGMLTRYSFGWLIVPVVVHLTLFGGPRRTGLAVAAGLAFVFVVTPWIARNLAVSGTYFGTAGYAAVEGTIAFPGSRLMQSLNPDLTSAYWVTPYTRKFLEISRAVFQNDLPRLGGGWVGILFFAGLLLGLRNVAARRLRYFTMSCLVMLFVVQAVGRTQMSVLSGDICSENLLALLTPLVTIFGVAFFLTLLDQMKTPGPEVRYGVIALLLLITTQPLIGSLLPPKPSPVVYPPYYPPEIQKISDWMHRDELMMSDIPWAVAWYGNRQCAWITINSQYQFFELNDYCKTVSALYLTLCTLDSKLYSDCFKGGTDSWGLFALKSVAASQVPPAFPLKAAPVGLMTGLFLTDHIRWDSD